MAGSSVTNMSTWQPFSGIIPSAWGDDMVVTMDDKLHMTVTDNTQTVQGPMNFSNTSVMTFAGPFNNTNTNINTFAGPIQIGSDLLTKWDADNATVTRYAVYGYHQIIASVNTDNPATHDWSYVIDGTKGNHAYITSSSNSYIGIDLPHGSTVIAMRVTAMRDSSGTFSVTLRRAKHSDGTFAILAYVTVTATSFTEVSDTNIDDATIDNGTYSCHILIGNDNNTFRIRSVQIDYTVVRPQP